jgi:hypothetical protein
LFLTQVCLVMCLLLLVVVEVDSKVAVVLVVY